MSEYYQKLDLPHFDYQPTEVPGLGRTRFRGPVPDLAQPYLACIGAAQTFGRFTAQPYPAALAAGLGVAALNLGIGGVGPRYWLQPELLAVVRRARLVVVQIMAGRSASNSLFDNSASGDLKGRLRATGETLRFEQFLERLVAQGDRAVLERVVAETRADYVAAMRALGAALAPVPTVLLWFSSRRPEYTPDYRSAFGILQAFPQLLDRGVVDAIRPAFSAYVESVCALGIPQVLWPSGGPVDGTELGQDGMLRNRYYPSPEMHGHAAAALLPVCRQLLG
jgi:hypothetical protein